MSKEPVVINVDLDSGRSIREQIDTPENREKVAEVVRNAMGSDKPAEGLWPAEPPEPAPPVAFQTERKGLLDALSRTQHAHASDPDANPVMHLWWLTVKDDRLTIHASDGYRLARATLDVIPTTEGTFALHRSDGKAILAFLAKGPDDVYVQAEGGAFRFSHEDGILTGHLGTGKPPDWSRVTVEPVLTWSMNGKFASEAAKAATGPSGVVLVEFETPDKPTAWRSEGYAEWVMPVRVGGAAQTAED